MAFEYFMNMEILSLTISKETVVKMTDDNMEDDLFLDEEKIENNIKNGFIVITQLSTFFESFLNTILNSCINCSEEKVLKMYINEKLEFIFDYYKKDFSSIKLTHYWESYKKLTKIRNEMIHYKLKGIGVAGGIPNFLIGGITVKDYFTKAGIEKVIADIEQLSNLIAQELGLYTYPQIDIFECEAKNGFTNYVSNIKVEDIS